MSVKAVEVFELHCDECGAAFEWEEFGNTGVWNYPHEVAEFVAEWDSQSEWSTDGEGHVRCAAHDRLELTQAAKDEAARKPGPGDVPLLEVEPTVQIKVPGNYRPIQIATGYVLALDPEGRPHLFTPEGVSS